ncbi:MAG: tetratricopeptide repeat protein [Chitinophagales bacterium]|jgi:tetratricopeptide (TPR) repeat protein
MLTAKHIAIFLLSFTLLAGCNSKKKKDDTETNAYYADYVAIYKNYKHANTDSTKQALETYLKKFPLEAKAWSFLGTVYLDGKEYDKALPIFQKAITLDSNLAHPYSAIGFLYYKKKDFTNAETYYTKGFAKGDTSLQSSINKVVLHSFTSAADSCRKEIAQLQSKTIKEQQFLFAIACVYHRLNDTAKRDSFFSICDATKALNKTERAAILKDETSISDFQESISK